MKISRLVHAATTELKRLKGILMLLIMLPSCFSGNARSRANEQNAENGVYVSPDRPGEYIEISGSKIHFVVSFKGWPGREVRYEDNEHDYDIEADNRLFMYPMRSASPIIGYDWIWDPKKKTIVQAERVSKPDEAYTTVPVRYWVKRKR